MLWNAETGERLNTLPHKAPVHFVNFSIGGKMLLTVTDPFMEENAKISIFDLAGTKPETVRKSSDRPRLVINVPGKHTTKMSRALFHRLNQVIISCHADGTIREWNTDTGECVQEIKAHDGAINDMQFSADGIFIITSSSDNTAKLWDASTLNHLKTYTTARPVNSASISPVMHHIALGGGQEASQVTTTSNKSGKFEVRFFSQIYQHELGTVGGHFGPINSLAFNPDGKSYSSGAEEGYVRICHFDADYFVVEEE